MWETQSHLIWHLTNLLVFFHVIREERPLCQVTFASVTPGLYPILGRNSQGSGLPPYRGSYSVQSSTKP